MVTMVDMDTELRKSPCTWFGEVCLFCSLTALPGPAWILLNCVLQRLFLYIKEIAKICHVRCLGNELAYVEARHPVAHGEAQSERAGHHVADAGPDARAHVLEGHGVHRPDAEVRHDGNHGHDDLGPNSMVEIISAWLFAMGREIY